MLRKSNFLPQIKELIGIRGQNDTTESIEAADITGPYFDAHIPNNVTAIVGKSAFLRCKVKNLANKTVNAFTAYN